MSNQLDQLTFWISFSILSFLVIYCNSKHGMLKDANMKRGNAPYSWARVQMAWWSIIISSLSIALFFKSKHLPQMNMSTVILLSISGATIAAARAIDTSEQANPKLEPARHQNSK